MKSYIINLDSRPDRLALATEELKNVGIEAERFRAFTADEAGGNRMLAFNMSQYYCIKKAVEAGHERFAIFEDDVAFTDDAVQVIADAVREANNLSEGAILHLGCNLVGMNTTKWEMPEKVTKHTARVYNFWQTHAVLWSIEAANYVLQHFPFHTIDYAPASGVFDEWLRTNFCPHYPVLVCNPMVAYQRPDFSDLNQAHSDYTYCFTEGNAYLKKL